MNPVTLHGPGKAPHHMNGLVRTAQTAGHGLEQTRVSWESRIDWTLSTWPVWVADEKRDFDESDIL